MVAGQQIWYVPFAGDWRDPRRWKNEMHRSPKGVSRALLGVGRLLPDPAVFGTNWAGHQLAADIFARRERWRILEAGAIASLLPPFVAGTPRALPPLHEDYTVRFIDNYLETSAELRAGLLFLNLGFRLVRDPVNAGRGRDPGRRLQPGPDWFAFRGRHAFGVEVICPRESDDILGRWQFLTHATFTAMDLLQGRNVSLSFDSSALSGLTNGLWFDAKRTDSLLLDLVADAASDGRSHTELGTLEPAQPGFGTMIGPINHDEAHEVERLRGQLVDKAGQLRKLPHTGKRRHPGIIVVDTSQDPQLMGRSGAIAAMLNEARRDWAADLACVILVASTWPGFALTIVVGPRYEPFAETSLPGLRKCARGHFHVDAFGRSPQDCQLDKYDNFAPLCAA